MSITVIAHTVVGVRIPKEKLYCTKLRKTFNHDFPETVKFSPETGKKLWELNKWEPVIPGVERGDDRFMDLKLVNGPESYKNDEYDIESFYIGKSFETSDYKERVSFIDQHALFAAKVQVRATLQPLGLWDEENFGVWTVLYVG